MTDAVDAKEIRIGLMEVALAIRESAQRIAGAMDRQAEATILLARATAGEFSEAEEGFTGQSLSDTPGRGMR